MIIHSAKYFNGCASLDKCPKSDLPEFAFIGRSNVGKSSLINFLTQNNKLAMTSPEKRRGGMDWRTGPVLLDMADIYK